MILFINACVRADSRTRRIAEHYLRKYTDEIHEVCLGAMDFPKVNEAFLEMRDACSLCNDFSDPVFQMAKDFAVADEILIAAPFWDLSFPSTLKQYLEQVTVSGITFFYTEEGIPQGLCNAKKLRYITTAGGPIFCEDYGFGYVKALATQFFGIKDVEMIKAEGLDIIGADVEKILSAAMQ